MNLKLNSVNLKNNNLSKIYFKKRKSQNQNLKQQNFDTVQFEKPVKKQKLKTKNKKQTLLKVLGLLAVSASVALTAVFAVTKNKKTDKFLESKIDFIPARTIEEARDFAFEKLKIKEYFLEDLSCANYVNEALVEFNNKSKDNKEVIDIVLPFESETLVASFANSCFKNILLINEKALNSAFIPSLRDVYMLNESMSNPKIKLSDEQKQLFGKIVKFSKNLTISEKTQAKFYLTQLELLDSMQPLHKMKEVESSTLAPCSKFSVCYHEIGHGLHKKNIGKKLFREYNYYGSDASWCSLFFAKERFRKELGKENFNKILLNVSYYAGISPDEFVAEVFSGLADGVEYGDDIMKLYDKYGGVRI